MLDDLIIWIKQKFKNRKKGPKKFYLFSAFLSIPTWIFSLQQQDIQLLHLLLHRHWLCLQQTLQLLFLKVNGVR